MKADLYGSARDGFVGSFRLAALIVVALAAVLSGFVNGEAATAKFAQSKLHH